MVGLYLMYAAQTGADLLVSGVLLGIGVAGTGINSLVGAVGRAAPPEQRTAAIASLGMAGGIGGFVAFPYTHLLIDHRLEDEPAGAGRHGCRHAAAGPAVERQAGTNGGMVEAADARRGIQGGAHAPELPAAMAGFFVCGFHVAFYGVHLPAFVADKGLDASVAVIALTMVGLGNLVGTYIAGQSGRFIEKRRGLSLIYFGRCFVFLGFLFLPITPLDGDRAQRAARPVLAVDRAADLQPGGDFLRHKVDVDAVRGGVPVASGRVVHRPLDGGLSLRSDQVV